MRLNFVFLFNRCLLVMSGSYFVICSFLIRSNVSVIRVPLFCCWLCSSFCFRLFCLTCCISEFPIIRTNVFVIRVLLFCCWLCLFCLTCCIQEFPIFLFLLSFCCILYHFVVIHADEFEVCVLFFVNSFCLFLFVFVCFYFACKVPN